jgi:hypothetical protein
MLSGVSAESLAEEAKDRSARQFPSVRCATFRFPSAHRFGGRPRLQRTAACCSVCYTDDLMLFRDYDRPHSHAVAAAAATTAAAGEMPTSKDIMELLQERGATHVEVRVWMCMRARARTHTHTCVLASMYACVHA